jgi:branched-chain amino acid aminotransferase
MENIKYILKKNRNINLPEDLGFGKVFTDHVFEMDYNTEKGWHNPAIKPLENLSMHPATMVLHYGQEIFEGLKAFKTVDGRIVLFRPEEHVKRFNNSARRMCIPEVGADFLLRAMVDLVNVERDWIPEHKGQSLYIRPFIIGTDAFLGVRASTKYKLITLLSPVAAYYAEGFKPVKILAEDKQTRAVKGMGECKTAGNYAASLYVASEAKKKGFTQVLWLDAVERKYIEEVGTMNIFIAFENEIVTPALDGGILPGITRKSVISILKNRSENITERKVTIDEIVKAYDDGTLKEIFGTGTAAVVSPVGWLTYKDKDMVINNGKPGEIALKLFDEITSIQYGEKEDSFGWLTEVEKEEVKV